MFFEIEEKPLCVWKYISLLKRYAAVGLSKSTIGISSVPFRKQYHISRKIYNTWIEDESAMEAGRVLLRNESIINAPKWTLLWRFDLLIWDTVLYG